MYVKRTRITIIRSSAPAKGKLNDELQWIGSSLGLFNMRDKDKSCFRIFIELIKASKQDKKLSSDDLAARLNLSRGTVVHHLSKLMQAGLVGSEKNKYFLRESTLHKLLETIESDMHSAMHELREKAKEIDTTLGL